MADLAEPMESSDPEYFYKKHPWVKIFYVRLIERTQTVLDKAKNNSQVDYYCIPEYLEKCEDALSSLKKDRAADRYEESINGKELDIIQEKLEKLTNEMRGITKTESRESRSARIQQLLLNLEALGRRISERRLEWRLDEMKIE